jgi:g-D-glutamyl-meso-diaminopimelate peptidase
MTCNYVVRTGDTLFRIARRCGIALQALTAANPQLTDAEHLVPGQVLHLPARNSQRYVLQAGDTLNRIAQSFHLAPDDLLAANPGLARGRMKCGQTIIVPPGRGRNIVKTDHPYGYEELRDDLERLVQLYPFLKAEKIGESAEGRDLIAVRIGSGNRRIHYNGAFHANEWMTSLLLMKFIEDYAGAYAEGRRLRGRSVRRLYEETALWLVPMVNPDGVELVLQAARPHDSEYEQLLEWNRGSACFRRWKANIRGVDLNDQFPAHWEEERNRRETEGPGPRDYPGPAPLTEPESQAMAAFTRSRDFRLVIALHTQGKEIYWNYRGLEPPESRRIAERFARVSGYRDVELAGSDAGYKDWFIQEYRRPGFTVECGIGVNPLPLSQFPDLYDETIEILLEGLSV